MHACIPTSKDRRQSIWLSLLRTGESSLLGAVARICLVETPVDAL